MWEALTKSKARNIFYGGSLFFLVIFVALTAHSHYYIVNASTDKPGLTASVVRGKHMWEKNSCINCHSILGEGAYFAPELGNVWVRYQQPGRSGGGARLKAWILAQPTGIEGRRQMPSSPSTAPSSTT